jgi:hypothetical protein
MSVFALYDSAMRHGGNFLAILAAAWVALLPADAAHALKPPRPVTSSAPPMTFLAANEFEAISFIENGTNAATALFKPAARDDKQAAQLFGMETESVAAGELPENGTTSLPLWLEISRWLRNAMQMGRAPSPRKN